MVATRALWGSLRPLGLAVAVLLAAGGAWGQTTWTKYEGNPVLERGAPGEWDDGGAVLGVVHFDGATFHMWYDGGRGSGGAEAIGYATSPDGVTWSKYTGNPVIERGQAGAFDAGVIYPGTVHWDGTTFHLWYLAHPSSDWSGPRQTGYATSPDGVSWTKHPENPVLTVGGVGTWDEGGVGINAVLAEGGTYRAWYAGYLPDNSSFAIGYAESHDGAVWNKRPEPVFRPSSSGWDAAWLTWASVSFDGSMYHMWYAGLGSGFGVGHAVSADGIHWARQPAQEPVLEGGGPGAFDEVGIDCPHVRLIGDTAHMWYLGQSSDETWSLGYASGPLPFEDPPLLLNGGRFLVESMWWTADGGFGYGNPYPLTDDSGAFTFFDPANIEILVKVLDGCAINQRYWVFVAGLTDVGVTLTVTDTETGARRHYTNTLGEPFAPIQDTDAFGLCE